MTEKLRTSGESSEATILAQSQKPQESNQKTPNMIHDKIDEIAKNFKDFPVIGDIIQSLANHLKGLVDAIKGSTNFNLTILKKELSSNSIPENAKGAIGNAIDKGLSYIAPTAAAAVSTFPPIGPKTEKQENTHKQESVGKDFKKWSNENTLGKNYNIATEFFVKKGLTLQQSIGIVTNLHHESGLKTNAVGDAGKAKGIAQWHPDRRQAILNGTGINVATAPLEKQLEALWWEITKGGEQASYKALLQCKTEEEAAKQFCILFERPANKHKRAAERAITANKIMIGKNLA